MNIYQERKEKPNPLQTRQFCQTIYTGSVETWDGRGTVAGMKTVEFPPLSRTSFHAFSSPPRILSNILHVHGRQGTVFPPLSSTVDSPQLKPSRKSRSKVNGTTSASQKLSPPYQSDKNAFSSLHKKEYVDEIPKVSAVFLVMSWRQKCFCTGYPRGVIFSIIGCHGN